MYKDKDRQREANRERQRRHRSRCDLIRGYRPKGVTNTGCDSQGVTESERDKAIEFMSKTAGKAERAESKRGKDIKVFEDLPPDVRATINRLSTIDGKIDQIIKANRTAIAVHYQHLFPDRYHSTGVVL